ncbi:MAG: sulfite exporter TauE/SafE family protein [Planctomycetota bacterium]|jgi:uncharacterized membrane protein YfcA
MEYALLVIVGLIAGVLGGLLGVGGSVVMIPAMVAIFANGGGKDIQQYQAAAMIVNFLLIAPSVLRHARAGAIYRHVWKWLAPAALVGIVGGVVASRLSVFTGENQHVMRIVFGAFLIYVALYNVWKLLAKATDVHDPESLIRPPRWKILCVALPMGFSAGLLGIGGGALAVPAQQIILRLPLRNAIATSAATILSISWLGAIVKNASLGADGTIGRSLMLAALLAPTAMIGSYIGGHLTHTLPLRIVRIAFVGLMLVSALKMFGWI